MVARFEPSDDLDEPEEPAEPETPLAERLASEYRGAIAYHLDTFWTFDDNNSGWTELPLETLLSWLAVTAEETSHASQRLSRNRLLDVVGSLRARLAVYPDQWNADPNLLPCPNGLLDLATGELHEHAAGDHYLRTCGAAYLLPAEPAACPVWDLFLKTTVPAEADFLQEFAGLALTFDDRFEIAVWLHGPAGSGKSTFVRGMEIILGQRAASLNLLALARGQLTPASLFGRSLLISVEQPIADLKHDHLINALLSGEPIPVRGPGGQLAGATARTSAKWLWALTSLPAVAYGGSGLFRRARLVRFPHRPEAQREPNLKAALSAEGPGMLRWALAGLARLRARGRFSPPVTVRVASELFRIGNDPVAEFLLGCTISHPSRRVQSGQLYSHYKSWCSHNDHRPLSTNAMALELERLGYERRRSDGRAYWHGLDLNLPPEPPKEPHPLLSVDPALWPPGFDPNTAE
jgi:putative DNA primase/helicase